jgi:hypothetical protein
MNDSIQLGVHMMSPKPETVTSSVSALSVFIHHCNKMDFHHWF